MAHTRIDPSQPAEAFEYPSASARPSRQLWKMAQNGKKQKLLNLAPSEFTGTLVEALPLLQRPLYKQFTHVLITVPLGPVLMF